MKNSPTEEAIIMLRTSQLSKGKRPSYFKIGLLIVDTGARPRQLSERLGCVRQFVEVWDPVREDKLDEIELDARGIARDMGFPEVVMIGLQK